MNGRAETCIVKRKGRKKQMQLFNIKMNLKSGALEQKEGQNGAQRGESSVGRAQGTVVTSIKFSSLLVVGEQQEACEAAGNGSKRTVANAPLLR